VDYCRACGTLNRRAFALKAKNGGSRGNEAKGAVSRDDTLMTVSPLVS